MQGLTVGVVVGVTPDKWLRVWRDRMPDLPLRVEPVEDPAAALRAGIDLVFARLPHQVEAAVHVIPLWEEMPVVVAAKNHPVKVFESVTLADLADEEHYSGWDEGVLDIVAAGHGVVVMPQSVYRATGRRDLVARPVTDAEPTRIALVWLRSTSAPEIDEFIGVVRGRTANSSRGSAEPAPPQTPRLKVQKPPPPKKRAQAGRTRPLRPGQGRRPKR